MSESFLIAVAIAAILFFVCWPFRITGASMENALRSGEITLISRAALLAPPNRGDIVLFRAETGRGSENLVKRVIGLPGETVEVAPAGVFIDGSPLAEPYARGGGFGAITIDLGADEYFVMGDNRAVSVDSRDFGPVPRGMMIGKVIAVILPPRGIE
jgi:signal peptidase I